MVARWRQVVAVERGDVRVRVPARGHRCQHCCAVRRLAAGGGPGTDDAPYSMALAGTPGRVANLPPLSGGEGACHCGLVTSAV